MATAAAVDVAMDVNESGAAAPSPGVAEPGSAGKGDEARRCANCGGAGVSRCARCRSVYYCSEKCQREHWTKGNHKKSCRPVAAADEEGGGAAAARAEPAAPSAAASTASGAAAQQATEPLTRAPSAPRPAAASSPASGAAGENGAAPPSGASASSSSSHGRSPTAKSQRTDDEERAPRGGAGPFGGAPSPASASAPGTALPARQTSMHEDVLNKLESDEAEVERAEKEAAVSGLREKAAQLQRDGDYEGAFTALSEALASSPSDARLFEARSGVALLTGRLEVATADATKAMQLLEASGASSLKAQVRLLRALLRRGSLAEAVSRGEAVMRADPTNAPASADLNAARMNLRRLDAAQEARRSGMWGEAAALCTKVLQDSPGCLEAMAIKAEAFAKQGELDDAFALTSRVMRDLPPSAAGGPTAKAMLNLRANILFQQERLEQCQKHLRELLNTDPDDATAAKLFKRVRKIQRLKQEGDDAFNTRQFQEAATKYAECLAELEGEVGLKTLRSRVHSNRAGALSGINQFEEAIKDCDAAIELDPEFAKAYSRRALCLRSLGGKERLERAIYDYEKAEKLAGGATAESRENIRRVKQELKLAKRKDYYGMLGISNGGASVSTDDIKKAYKKAALKWHPDRHTNSTPEEKAEAERMFKEVSEACDVLTNDRKRRLYDQGLSLEEIEQRTSSEAAYGGHHQHYHPYGGHPFAGGGFGGPFGGGFGYGYEEEEDDDAGAQAEFFRQHFGGGRR